MIDSLCRKCRQVHRRCKKAARGSEVIHTPSDRRTSIGIANLWISSTSLGVPEALGEEIQADAEASSVTGQRTRLELEVKAELHKLFTKTAPLHIKRKFYSYHLRARANFSCCSGVTMRQ